jgi:hypothetical protein
MATFWINTKLTCDIQTEVPESMYYFSARFFVANVYQAVPLLRPSFAGPSSWRPGFNNWPIVVGFVMGQVEMRAGFPISTSVFVIFVNPTDALCSAIHLSPTLYSVTVSTTSVNSIRLGDYPVMYCCRP